MSLLTPLPASRLTPTRLRLRFASKDAYPRPRSKGTTAGDESAGPNHSHLQINSETKTISTASGQLPISPLMDPSFYESRQKFTQPKNPDTPIHQKIRWRRILQRNPYARALAGPIRTCPVTRATLPRDFLQQFSLVKHPETGEPWWVPAGLDSTEQVSVSEDNKGDSSKTAASEAAKSTEDEALQVDKEGQDSKIAHPRGPSAYVLARRDLLDAFRAKGSAYSRGEKRISISSSPRWTSTVGRAVWREDMAAWLLELMRRRVVDQLLHLCRTAGDRNRKYVVRCETWDDASRYTLRGCLLWLGAGEGEKASDTAGQIAAEDPPRLSIVALGGKSYGSKLVAHNLQLLLGDEHISRLRNGMPLLRDGSSFLLREQQSIDLQLLLWKLQGYMA